MSIKSKLSRMKNHLQTNGVKESQTTTVDTSSVDRKNTNKGTKEESFRRLGFEPFYFDGEKSYRKRIVYSYETDDQMKMYKEMTKMKAFWEKGLANHPLSFHGKPLENLLFFDTETTGLSTGAGNVIFLIGYARLKADGIEVTQHILESPSNEAAFLTGFLEDFTEDDYLITYNGKSFDWPQVKSRHDFIRKKLPKLPSFGHIDLLHCTRRLWKHDLPSCRLSIVEEHILKIRRTNDIPGSMAPLLYFDYLHEGDPFHLQGVIDHNDQDIRSLVQLYLAISNRLFHWKTVVPSPMEHFYIGDWFEKLALFDWAKIHFEQAIQRMNRPFALGYYRLGLLSKKVADKQQALDYFILAINQERSPPVEVWIELAKLAEHHEKDNAKAFQYAKKASIQLKKSHRFSGSSSKLKKQMDNLNDRLNRLHKKINS